LQHASLLPTESAVHGASREGRTREFAAVLQEATEATST